MYLSNGQLDPSHPNVNLIPLGQPPVIPAKGPVPKQRAPKSPFKPGLRRIITPYGMENGTGYQTRYTL